MTAFLRPASPALAAALAGGGVQFWAELFTITLADGVTKLCWTNFDSDLVAGGVRYTSQGQYLSRSAWKVSNTMEVPSLQLRASSLNTGYNGGPALQVQIHNGLLDGAVFAMAAAFMGADRNPDTLGTMPLFTGKVAGIDLDGVTAEIVAKGKVNDLDQYAPRNLYQVGCNHAFCDTGCGLKRAAFTAAYAVGPAPSPIFIPWAGAAPANAATYQNGTLVVTSGAAASSRRTITQASAAGLALAYPLAFVPAPGDAFTALQGCDKTFNSGSPQSCTAYANTQAYRGFPHVPPPASSY